jgi:hypothetical protein
MNTSQDRAFAVITADVIGSTGIDGFPEQRDERLTAASAAHLSTGLVLNRYTVTTWDEFQTIVANPSYVPRVVFDLRRRFRPMRLRIGVGVGRIQEPIKDPINELSGGEAFVLAREAVESLNHRKGQKFEKITSLRSSHSGLQEVANLVFDLQDSLVRNISQKQWATISAQDETGSQDVAARRLGVDKSTVSRNLQRAFYWQLEASIKTFERVIEQLLHSGVQPPESWT